jgi:hypothetical protein
LLGRRAAGAAAAERSFAQLLSTSGIASIHFAANLSQQQFARFVRAFPSGNAKPTSLAEQLKLALAGEVGIKVNEIRYIAEDSSIAGAKIAANLTAKVLGAQGDKFKDFLDDPNRLLQMILAAEAARRPRRAGRRWERSGIWRRVWGSGWSGKRTGIWRRVWRFRWSGKRTGNSGWRREWGGFGNREWWRLQ